MDSSIIGKIDKARKYAEEKERVRITSFQATFQGNHNTYQVSFDFVAAQSRLGSTHESLSSGIWHCQCPFFATRRVCSHTMALQRMLDEVLARTPPLS